MRTRRSDRVIAYPHFPGSTLATPSHRPVPESEDLTYGRDMLFRDAAARGAATGVIAVALLTLAGCGGSWPTGPSAAELRASAASASAANSSASASASASAQRAKHDKCAHRFSPLLGALLQLDSRLTFGLQFADYTSRVGDARTAYDRAARGIKSADPQCISKVGIPFQSALNSYTTAGDIWNNCIQDYTCEFTKGSPALTKAQTAWSAAASKLRRGESGLQAMTP